MSLLINVLSDITHLPFAFLPFCSHHTSWSIILVASNFPSTLPQLTHCCYVAESHRTSFAPLIATCPLGHTFTSVQAHPLVETLVSAPMLITNLHQHHHGGVSFASAAFNSVTSLRRRQAAVGWRSMVTVANPKDDNHPCPCCLLVQMAHQGSISLRLKGTSALPA